MAEQEPGIPTLTGRLVRLETLTDAHAEPLLASITTDEVWAWKPVPRPRTVEEYRRVLAARRRMAGVRGEAAALIDERAA